MTTYTAQTASRRGHAVGYGEAATVKNVQTSYDIPAALALNDALELMWIPKGARIVKIEGEVDDLDTGGSPAIDLHIGDTADPDRYAANLATAQAGGAIALNLGGNTFTYPHETLLTVTCSTAPATGAAGNITLSVSYVLD